MRVKMNKYKLYLIIWKSMEGTDLGYLPFTEIPKSSILWKAIRRGELSNLQEGGLRGEDMKKVYANEHLRIEKKWREDGVRNDKLSIMEVK